MYCYRATHIYTTQTYVRNNGSDDLALMDVMLIGTDKGKILKIVMTYNGTHHISLIVEELSVGFPGCGTSTHLFMSVSVSVSACVYV